MNQEFRGIWDAAGWALIPIDCQENTHLDPAGASR